jgi:plastocyanin
MNQKYIVGILVLLVGAVGYLFFRINGLSESAPGLKSFNIVLQNQAYSPDTVKVKLGDTVIFNIDNKDNEDHGLHLPQFGVAEAVPPLQKTSVQFVASQAGSVATSCATNHPEKINVIVESS